MNWLKEEEGLGGAGMNVWSEKIEWFTARLMGGVMAAWSLLVKNFSGPSFSSVFHCIANHGYGVHANDDSRSSLKGCHFCSFQLGKNA